MIDAGVLDQVTRQFIDALKQDEQALKDIAHNLFYYLVLIQLVLMGLWSAFSAEPLNKLLGKIASLLLTYGIFYAGITHGSQWISQVINGFIQIGQASGVASISPSQVLQHGIEISSGLFWAFFNWGVIAHPFVAFIGGVICLAVIILYALLAAELVIVLVKSYVLVSLASLFFAFSSSPFTRPMLDHYFRSVLGIGLQLMTSYFLMAVGQTMGHDWASITEAAAKSHQIIPMLMIFATVIVYYMIVKNIPCFIASLSGVGGFRTYGDEAVSAVIGSSIEGGRQLSKSWHRGGQLLQSGAQAVSNTQNMVHSARHASRHGQNFYQKASKGTTEFLKSGASALGKTLHDTLMKHNTNLSAGQKINKHLKQRLKGKV